MCIRDSAEGVVPHPGRAVGQNGPQAAAEMGVAGRHAGKFHGRGVKIHQFRQAVADAGVHRRALGGLDEEGHPGEAVLEAVLAFFRQVVIPGKIAVVAEKEDGAVVIDARLFQRRHQAAELGVDLHAHALVHRPQLVPIGVGVIVHPCIFADLRQNFCLAGAVRRPDARGQFGPVDGGCLLYTSRCV